MLIPSSKLQQVTRLRPIAGRKTPPVASRIGGRRLERRCGPSRCEQQQSKSEDGIDESPECPSRLAVYGRRETHSRNWTHSEPPRGYISSSAIKPRAVPIIPQKFASPSQSSAEAKPIPAIGPIVKSSGRE